MSDTDEIRDMAAEQRERGNDDLADFAADVADAADALEYNGPGMDEPVIPEGIYLCLKCGGFVSDATCDHDLKERRKEPDYNFD